jgi:hypothetical protein
MVEGMARVLGLDPHGLKACIVCGARAVNVPEHVAIGDAVNPLCEVHLAASDAATGTTTIIQGEPWTILPTTDEDPRTLAFVPYSTLPDDPEAA